MYPGPRRVSRRALLQTGVTAAILGVLGSLAGRRTPLGAGAFVVGLAPSVRAVIERWGRASPRRRCSSGVGASKPVAGTGWVDQQARNRTRRESSPATD